MHVCVRVLTIGSSLYVYNRQQRCVRVSKYKYSHIYLYIQHQHQQNYISESDVYYKMHIYV